MEKKLVKTQENILEAARTIFAQKGLAGARMQEIADNAGINKALLHYYYKTKDKLFEQVFKEAFVKMMKPLAVFLSDDSELFQKIRNICHHYNNSLMEFPFLPNFILNEINTNPSKILKLIFNEGIQKGRDKTVNQIKKAVESGKIRPIEPSELVLNIISLSVFPFVGQPILFKVLYNNENMNNVLKARADCVADFVIQSIKL